VRVLIACEFSGIVRDAFAALGHDAWSCDLQPTERPGQHIIGDVLEVLADSWDLMVAHPPCTYLSRAGARWWKETGRAELATAARDFVVALWQAPIPRVAIENPIGRLNQLWRYPDQTIEPWYFGDPYTKRTCLWLRGLPPLMSTTIHTQTMPWVQGSSFARVSRTRRPKEIARGQAERSLTPPGLAAAMADQWGAALELAA
jgi:hypothetical protein